MFGLLEWPILFDKSGLKKSNFGNSCKETQNFGDFGLEKLKICNFSLENANSWHP